MNIHITPRYFSIYFRLSDRVYPLSLEDRVYERMQDIAYNYLKEYNHINKTRPYYKDRIEYLIKETDSVNIDIVEDICKNIYKDIEEDLDVDIEICMIA